MNTSQVKRIPLIAFLEALHFKPEKIRGNEYWYKSPFREEQTASFTVNHKKNTWYDFGSGEGGNIIDLAGKLFNTTDVSQILSLIEEKIRCFSFSQQLTNVQDMFATQLNTDQVNNATELNTGETHFLTNIKVRPLNNPALLDYIAARGIAGTTASQYCREVHYSVDGKHYFAIGFKNDSGGYELRNKYFKNCIAPKDYTLIKNDQRLLSVFEGFFDFLSYQELLKGIEYRRFMAGKKERTLLEKIIPQTDYLILNSVIHLKRATEKINGYQKLHLFFDNDQTGRSCVETIRKLCIPYEDISAYYNSHKDLNDYLKKAKQEPDKRLDNSQGLRL